MAVPNYLGFAQQPGVLQTAIGTAGQLQQQAAQREQMALAQQAEQRAQALAPYQLQTAKETAEEQPIKFKSDLANAVMTRRLQAAQAQKALTTDPFTSLRGPAADAYSLEAVKNKFGVNSDIYKNALNEFQASIEQKKNRAAFYGSNVWQKNWTTLQKTQFNEDWQKENAARQAKGLPPLTSDQFATAAGYKPADIDTKADAINAHIDQKQLNDVKNNKPITPAHKIIHDIVNGGDAGQPQVAPQSAPQVAQGQQPTQATVGQSTTTLAAPPASLQSQPAPTKGAPVVPQQGQAPQQPAQIPLAEKAPAQAPKLLTTPKYGLQAAQTGLATLKQTSDAQNRSKILYGNQAENTINNMLPDLDAIAAYSGPTGTTKLASDRLIFQQTGKPPPQYLAYQRFVANSAVLKDQVTQYFGKSITPTARDELDEITTPRNWIDAPAATTERFNAFVKTLRQEINIRKEALQNPNAYYSEKTGGAKSYTDADYQSTAKKYGMTVPQLKKYIASQKGK